MTLRRSVLCALVLLVGLPLAGADTAEAGRGSFAGRTKYERKANEYFGDDARVIVVVGEDSVANQVEVRVESDAGGETVTLVESDAWLHGAGKLGALPKTDAALTLTLYDKGNASLISFSGTLAADGSVTLAADVIKEAATCDAYSKTGCADDTSDTKATTLDIEVLAGEVFGASGAYELAVDLAGADTYEVAYAQITITESDEVTTCSKETGECKTTGSSTTTKAEVDWDAIGAVWDGDTTLDHEGVIETKVQTYDSAGQKLESAKAKLGAAWINEGDGVGTLATDEDPLTTVGILRNRVDILPNGAVRWVSSRLAINSEGWTSTTVPVSAKVELTSGGTITIPVNSYQRLSRPSWAKAGGVAVLSGLISNSTITITGGNFELYDVSILDLATPTCLDGTCFTLVETEEDVYELSVSEYGTDATKLADDIELTVSVTDEFGKEVFSETGTVEFDDDVTAVFANEVTFSQDPIGLDLSGKVSLLGAADKKGKQKTLAKGKFYGSFSRDGDGDLSLLGADKDAISSQGSIVVAGASVAVEITTDTNKDGVFDPPPLTPVFGNGSGTKNASHQASTKPELL